MKKRILSLFFACIMAFSLLTACGSDDAPQSEPAGGLEESGTSTEPQEEQSTQIADASDMAEPVEVLEEGMEPVYGSALKDGVYEITVSSSSSMFSIISCELTVEAGEMTAVMTMGGTGYLYVYPGTAEEAVKADETAYITYKETAEGAHTFTVPVEALDMGIDCAAFSKRKELWYDRTLVFRADSLPAEAFADGVITTPESLGLSDGAYTIEVAVEGGSGRASVTSPAKLTVENGVFTAELIWSSSNYDYMKVDGVQYLPVNTEGNSAFEIPVTGLDYKMPVLADTTAMSQPYEIEYTLYFDSATIQAAQ